MLAGMIACLCSSYISSTIALMLNADALVASLEITPVIEEIMKLMPMLFYLLVFEAHGEEVSGEALMVAVGFATMENKCPGKRSWLLWTLQPWKMPAIW